MSRLIVYDDELDHVHKHLTSTLTYAARVQEIARDIAEPVVIVDPRLRADVARAVDAEQHIAHKVLLQAPKYQENLFVVPKIL